MAGNYGDDNTRIPSFKDLGNPHYFGPPPPAPPPVYRAPPPPPYVHVPSWKGDTPTRKRDRNPQAQVPAKAGKANQANVAVASGPPKPLGERALSAAFFFALCAGGVAWLGPHGSAATIAIYAGGGALAGGAIVLAIAAVVKTVQIAVAVTAWCLKAAVVLAGVYFVVSFLAGTYGSPVAYLRGLASIFR